jgi:hypothetical protein
MKNKVHTVLAYAIPFVIMVACGLSWPIALLSLGAMFIVDKHMKDLDELKKALKDLTDAQTKAAQDKLYQR